MFVNLLALTNLLTNPFSPPLAATEGWGASPGTCQSNCLLVLVSLLPVVNSSRSSRFLGGRRTVSLLLRSETRGVGGVLVLW